MLTLNRSRERAFGAVAAVAAGAVALVVSLAVPADDLPGAYYSAVSAVIPLLLIALFTAFGRDRADVLDISREVDLAMARSPQAAERLRRYLRPIHSQRVQVRDRFILATVVAAIGEAAALIGIASHSTTLLLAVTIVTMLGLVIVAVAAEIADLEEIPDPDEDDG